MLICDKRRPRKAGNPSGGTPWALAAWQVGRGKSTPAHSTQSVAAAVSIKGTPRLARVLATLRAAPASRGRYAPLTPPYARLQPRGGVLIGWVVHAPTLARLNAPEAVLSVQALSDPPPAAEHRRAQPVTGAACWQARTRRRANRGGRSRVLPLLPHRRHWPGRHLGPPKSQPAPVA